MQQSLRPFPSKFILSTPIKVLRVEQMSHPNAWMIWLMANGDFTLGTFIRLCDNGEIHRVTWHEDGTETVMEM
jgi:hypothetical protein